MLFFERVTVLFNISETNAPDAIPVPETDCPTNKLFIDPTVIVFCPDVPDIDVELITTDLLINPKNGSKVSSSLILNPSKPTYVVELPDGVIVIPILLIDDLSGADTLAPAKIKDIGMSLVIVCPKLDGALI